MDKSPAAKISDARPRAGRGRRREARQANLQRILAAAAQVFSQAGYDGATMTDIAEAAGLPKPNVNYYFREKLVLYRRVLRDVQAMWLEPLQLFRPEADPVEALEAYIRAKISLARRLPIESRVFANEMIHGAPFIGQYLRTEYNRQIAPVWETFEAWINEGLIDPIDPKHLMIQIWAATQTYADHEPQVLALFGGSALPESEYDAAARQLVALVVKGIGARSKRPLRSKPAARSKAPAGAPRAKDRPDSRGHPAGDPQ